MKVLSGPGGHRRAVALGAVLLVIGGSGAAWALTRGSSTAAAATTSLVTLATGDVQQAVSTTGTIEPAQDQDLSFPVSGTVTKVTAAVGQKVAKGTVLATLDSTALQTAVDTATAAVTAAEQQVSAVSSSTSTQIASAAAQLASARTDLATAQADLADATLRAPFSGTVAAVALAAGDVVGSSSSGPSSQSSSSSSAASTSTITLITTDRWVVNASVGSADLAQLKKGMQAQITPTGASQLVFGTVSSIGIVATASTSGSATFPVAVAVTGSPSGLYAGGSATVSLIVKQLSGVLTVPTLAVHSVNGSTVVYRRVGGKRVTTPVTLGASYGASTVVTKGLASGDQVEISFARPGGAITRRGTGTGTNRQQGTFPGGGFSGAPPGAVLQGGNG